MGFKEKIKGGRLITVVKKKLLKNYSKKIYSDVFVLTHRQEVHISKDHAADFDRIMQGLRMTLDDPSEIYEDDRFDGTLYFIRKLEIDNQNIVVKMNINNDKRHPCNSIITSYIVSDRAVRRIRNKGVNIYAKG